MKIQIQLDSKAVQHLLQINDDDEYQTPNDLYYEALLQYQISPKLDVAATDRNTKCDYYFTKEINALDQEWDQDFFMNPPYSHVEKFMKKAYLSYLKYNVNALILIYAKTDTKFWHSYIEEKAEVHFIKGRIRFIKNGIKTKNSAPYGSCWVIYRKKIQ